MRRLNLFCSFAVAEVVLLYAFVKLFLRADESRVLWLVVGFAVVQLALLALAMRTAERERDLGKNLQQVARERSRRDHALALWSGGIIYLLRLGFGLWHVSDSGWSLNLIIQLALWT